MGIRSNLQGHESKYGTILFQTCLNEVREATYSGTAHWRVNPANVPSLKMSQRVTEDEGEQFGRFRIFTARW